MPSLQWYALQPVIRLNHLLMGRLARGKPEDWAALAERFGALAERFTTHPTGVTMQAAVVGGVPGWWAIPERTTTSRPAIYMHGGALFTRYAGPLRMVGAHLALAYGGRVFGPDFRVLPSHHYPAAHDDCFAVYRALVEGGAAPLVVGDSSGGVLALATLLRARAVGLPQPPVCVLLSPSVDYAFRDSGIRQSRDPFVPHQSLIAPHLAYMAGADPDCHDLGPVYADLSELAPLVVFAGEHELLRTEVDRLRRAAERCGLPIEINLWPRMWHGWYVMADHLPEGRRVLEAAGLAMRSSLGEQPQA